jgi:hypothetical protein
LRKPQCFNPLHGVTAPAAAKKYEKISRYRNRFRIEIACVD